MAEILICVAAVVITILLVGVAAFRGYEVGVKDTERRWSDAVGRAEGDRASSHPGPGPETEKE